MRKLIIGILICLLPTSIMAGDFPQMEEELTVQNTLEDLTVSTVDTSYTTWNWVTLISMVLANSADAWTTNEGINVQERCKEVGIPARFIIGEYPSTGAIIGFKAVGTLLTIVIVEYFTPDEKLQKTRNIAYGLNAGIMSFVSVRNYGECVR